MNGGSSTAQNIAAIAQVANNAALSWYSTVTQKPVAPGAPVTLTRSVFGTDLGANPYTETALPAVILVGGIVIAAMFIFSGSGRRR